MLNIINKEFKEIIADKKIWIGILTVLIIIIISTSYNKPNTGSTADILKLGVINHDDSAYSGLLLSYFNGSKTFSSLITVSVGEEKEIKEAFQEGKLDIYLEIPKDFAMNMMHLEHSPINVTMNVSDTTKAILFQNVLKSYEKYISAVEANAVGLYDIMERDGMDPALIDQTNQKVSIDLVLTALGKEAFFSFRTVEDYPFTTLINYYISSVIILTLLYFGLYSGFQLLKEMKQGTLTRLRISRTSLPCFLTAKLVIIWSVLLLFSFTSVTILTRRSWNINTLLLSLAYAMFCVYIAVFFSAVFQTTQRFILAGNIFIFFSAILGGGIIPIQFLPQKLLLLSKFTPDYYMMRGILNSIQGQYEGNSRIILGFLIISAVLMVTSTFILGRRSVVYDEI